MGKLPKELKLTLHAQQRLEERKDPEDYYNTKNLMKSSCKWYTTDDFIPQSSLYLHSLYVCRKAKQKMGYITDGNIEVLYDKNAKVAITIMEVKEKFIPIEQYIKPEILEKVKRKKEDKKMKKEKTKIISICPDCGKKDELTSLGICIKCRRRLQNAKARKKEYTPYINLSNEEKKRIDMFQIVHSSENKTKRKQTNNKKEVNNTKKDEKVLNKNDFNFINILQSYGCNIPIENLEEVLNVLETTDKLKDICMTIAKGTNQQALLDLEQALNVVERKLQHNWEYNGFQEIDDIKFKSFLTWRRSLKGSIFFWKKLYQSNALIELQRAWNAYTSDPNDKILLAGETINSTHKRFQITTETISTIFNTRRPFTRVFYAASKEEAHATFVQWLADRQLHEDKGKTIITELTTEGENGKRIEG